MTFTQKFFRPVDNSPLILFRIIFGLLLFLEAWGAIFTGWVKRTFIDPDYTFPFMDFAWLQPLPGSGMYVYYVIMGIAGLLVMSGFYYRWSIGIYTVMWAGVYFMQKTNYNNHYYLLLLLCMLMCLVPAHKDTSIDVRRHPHLKSFTCPQWCLWIFALQISIVYCYAAVNKIYPDWLAAKPVGIWFDYKSDYLVIGPLLEQRWFQYVIAYGGILLDLLIVPALLWKRTRNAAFIALVFFHLFNSAVFQVGIFPYVAIAMSVFFFEPEVIRRIFFNSRPKPTFGKRYKRRPLFIYAFAGYFIIQILLPVRHLFYPGNVNWTEEGHRLSWRMMLRVKSGYVRFEVADALTDQQWTVDPDDYLTLKQSRAVATRPDMCWQFVQILKADFKRRGYPDVKIYARGQVSLNGRPRQVLYNSSIDLAGVIWEPFSSSNWLVPLKE